MAREYTIDVRSDEAWRDPKVRQSVISQARQYAGQHPGTLVKIRRERKGAGKAWWEVIGTYKNCSRYKHDWR